MSSTLPCPHCGAVIKVPPELSGRRIACSRCRHEVRPAELAAGGEARSVSKSADPNPANGSPADPSAVFAALSTQRRIVTRESKRQPSPASKLISGVRARPVASGLLAFGGLFALAATVCAVQFWNDAKASLADPAAFARSPEERVVAFAKEQVRKQLKNPLAAQFPGPLKVQAGAAKKTGFVSYKVTGPVALRNDAGAEIQPELYCEIRHRAEDDATELQALFLGGEALFLEPGVEQALSRLTNELGNALEGSAEERRKWAAIQDLAADAVERKLGAVRPLWPNDPTRHEWRVQLVDEGQRWKVTGRAIVQRSGQNKEILVEIHASTGRVETLQIEGVVQK